MSDSADIVVLLRREAARCERLGYDALSALLLEAALELEEARAIVDQMRDET